MTKAKYVEITAANFGDFVIASLNPPSVWGNYFTHEVASDSLAEASEYSARVYKNKGPLAVMTWDEYVAGERAYYVNKPEEAITGETFNEMFEVLPPIGVITGDGYFSFLMSEMYSGNWTSQFIQRGAGSAATYATKIVDRSDRSTWMDGTVPLCPACDEPTAVDAVCGGCGRTNDLHEQSE